MTWATPPWLVAALLAVSGVALAFAARAETPAGRFLALVLGAATGAEGLRALLLRPTLRADDDGIEVVTGLARQRYAWSEVAGVGTLDPPSTGGNLRRRAAALEIDLGDRLVVVPGYRLGAPVTDVAATLASTRSSGSGGL